MTDLAIPRALGAPDSGRRFTPAQMARRMRPLFIISDASITPAVSVHLDLLANFDRARVTATVALTRDADSRLRAAIPDDLEIVSIGLRPGLRAPGELAASARDLVGLGTMIRRRRIDVIHCDQGVRNGLLGVVLARLTGRRCVIHFHSQYGDWMSRPSQEAIRRADAIITVSAWTGEVIRDRAPRPAERIFPVLNGIDPSRYDPDGADGGGVRAELGVGPEDPLIVQVAQLVEWKRQADLVEAFAGVVERHPTAHLALVGAEREPERLGYTDGIRRQIDRLGLDGRVHLTGRRSDVPAVLAAADIFSLPSVGDPCALAHIEAMAMAKPDVTVDAGGSPELVVHGVTGLVGPAGDVAALADNLGALLDDPERAREMGRRARERILTELNVRRMSDEVEAVHRHLVLSD